MLIEIKSRYDGKVMHSLEAESLRDAIVQLVRLRADLRGANLRGADLRGADLGGAKISWTSHALIAEILLRAAGDDIPKRMVAGLIAVSTDWCWEEFLAVESDLREWALTELATWIQPNDGHPIALHAYVVAQEPREPVMETAASA